MAITTIDYVVFRKLREGGLIPPRPSLLELGEQEWYGDVSLQTLTETIDGLTDPSRREQLHRRMASLLAEKPATFSWDLTKLFYTVFLDYSRTVAIDLHGTETALRLDLNEPVDLGEQFDIVLNGGTAEHVFNLYQFFKSVHELTRPGGLMLHTGPFQGWIEHGFYSFHPGLFWDLAEANRYEMGMLCYAELDPPRMVQIARREQIVEIVRKGGLAANSVLYAVLRKPAEEAPFRIPFQGVYAGKLSDEMMEAWHKLR